MCSSVVCEFPIGIPAKKITSKYNKDMTYVSFYYLNGWYCIIIIQRDYFTSVVNIELLTNCFHL